MTLRVHTVLFDQDREMTLLDDLAPGADFAGFESFRTTVWGSDAMRALGARYFPVLNGENMLTVLPEEVADFLHECATVEAHLAEIAPHTDPQHSHGWHVEEISGRLATIQAAAERALEVGGGVLIW
ncbi:hypothetical protein [Nocardia pseudobrasiliensis]|uniref:DUF1877 family protein n=1 Tax=Nocardia pseudobrasiliensis TaxID=45979 RepID=A0A370HLX0_9NOCA|nr:hypothetical protein [Nocardia pseudobrasiliensis]RDI59041.1 hypothetical protein DFR76_1191 [Nocardia pseudobrasiliensis]